MPSLTLANSLRAIYGSFGFSPASLFSGGAPGVWYDPSDYSTLFQDSAGTTPVTAVEQPVGLMLDKSQGLVLGSELVTNGDFSNGDTGWILSAGVTVSGGTANWTAGASNLSARQTGILTVGKTYQVTYTISSISSGGFKVSIGAEGPIYTSAGTYTARLTASSTQISILSQGASTTGSIDNISVKELPGNHAFQATSASRPVLSARYNLLTKTEDLTDAVWVKAATVAVSSNFDGNADRVTYNGSSSDGASAFIQQLAASPGGTASRSFTVSATIKSAGTGNQTIRLKNTHSAVLDNFSSDITVTPTYQTFTFTVTNGASAGNGIQTAGLVAGTANAAYDIVVASFSIVPANQSTLPYQRVNTPTDYATTGFLPYLKFDGVDDSLSTNSISFTSTDKMSVFAGVRKLSDAAAAILVELSTNVNTNVRCFYVAAPDAVSPNYGFAIRGTTNVAGRTATTYASPITNVIAASYDASKTIPADQIVLRVNGTTPSSIANSGDPNIGTGNFGNYPLFIGRRNNTSLPFNGQIYSMIIVGKAVNAVELTSTETYTAIKTGVTIA